MDATELQKENERLKAALLEQRLQFQNELKVRLELEGQKRQQELQQHQQERKQHEQESQRFKEAQLQRKRSPAPLLARGLAWWISF